MLLLTRLKRPSHGKRKLANFKKVGKRFLRSFPRKTRVKSQHTVICNQADLVQWHLRRTVKQKKRVDRERWRNRTIWTISFVCCWYICRLRMKLSTAGQLWTSLINLKVALRSSWLASAILSHTILRIYQHENVDEKVGENKGKFYFSPTDCQRVCRLFLCHLHTPTWVCQLFCQQTLICFRPARSKPVPNLLSFLRRNWKRKKTWDVQNILLK